MHVRPSGEAFAVARDGKGLDDLADRLARLGPTLVVLEATAASSRGGGGAVRGRAAGCGGQPAPGPRLARSTGRFAVIAHEATDPEARPVPDEQARAPELVARRRQIVEMMTAERNRRARLASPRALKSVERLLKARTERPRGRDRIRRSGARPRTCSKAFGKTTARNRRSARIGSLDRRKLRRRALQPGQRHHARQAHRLGRPRQITWPLWSPAGATRSLNASTTASSSSANPRIHRRHANSSPSSTPSPTIGAHNALVSLAAAAAVREPRMGGRAVEGTGLENRQA